MTDISVHHGRSRWPAAADVAGYAIAAAVVVLFAFYGTYFAHTLVTLGPEQAVMDAARAAHGSSAYVWILRGWQSVAGDTVLAARTLSLLAGVLSIVLAFDAARRLTGEVVSAAALILQFVFFPPLVATCALATPHALFVLVCMAVMRLMQETSRVGTAVAVGLALMGATLHPLGIVVMPLWLFLCGLLLGRNVRLVLVGVIAISLGATVVSLATERPPVSDPDLALSGRDTVFHVLFLPYAMVFVGALLSALALCAARVRQVLGVRRVLMIVLGFAAAGTVLLAQWLLNPDSARYWATEAVLLFPLVVLAPWPLVYWVRYEMPNVRSVVAWIAFPVIMYSCFWVLLGPIDPARFPYSHRSSGAAIAP